MKIFYLRKEHNLRCKGGNIFQCQCGGGGGRSKAEAGLSQAGRGVEEASRQTPEESQQYTGSFEIGKTLEQLRKYFLGLENAPSGYIDPTQQFLRRGGEVGQNYYEQIRRESQDPYHAFESTFQPALQQAQTAINQYYQGRGLLKSGLAIEGMGRAGVDLAIKEAQNRMAARESSLGRQAGFLDTIRGQEEQDIGALTNLYGQQQQYGLQSRGRQAEGMAAAAPYYAYPYQARLGDIYGRQAALYALPGQALGAAGYYYGAKAGAKGA